MKRLAILAVAGLSVFADFPQSQVHAQTRAAVSMGSRSQLINLPRGSSMAVDLPADARDVIVPDPTIAEAMLHSPRRITIIGLQPGETDAVVLDSAGRTILSLRVRVDAGTSALQDTLSRIIPGSRIRAEAVNDSIILSGPVGNPGEADRAAQVARAFVSEPEKVINMMTIMGSDQVMVKARVIEVQRSAIKQLGLSTNAIVNAGTQYTSGGFTTTYGVNGSQMGGGNICVGQNGARTTNFTNNNTTNNQTSSGSNTSNSNSNTINNNSTNTITNTTSNSTGTTLTTSDGRTIQFTGSAPGRITVTDLAGNTVTLSGTTAADYLRSTVSGTSLTSAISGVLGSTVANSVSSIIGSIVTSNTGNLLSNSISNAISSVFQTVTGTTAGACLQAFERAGLVRTLAEPNLTSVNGESAEFLAGGEFPVPVGRTVDATTGQTTIGIEFKPFGVRLAFRPIVLSEGRISLQLSTEVSELTTSGAFTLGGGDTGDALVIPALNVRRASSTVELPSGGSMMIAGLLREDTRQNIDQLPGIGNLPVLGSLFRSRDYLSGETELVIIIEAYIVSPTSPGNFQTPADGLIIANDAQTLLFGQLNQQYRPATSATPTADSGWAGPVGYVIE